MIPFYFMRQKRSICCFLRCVLFFEVILGLKVKPEKRELILVTVVDNLDILASIPGCKADLLSGHVSGILS